MPWAHGTVAAHARRRPNFWDANFVRVEGDGSDLEPRSLVTPPPTSSCADCRHRKLEVEDEVAGAPAAAVLRRRRLGDRAQRGDGARRARRRAHADVEEVSLLETRAAARRVVPRLRERRGRAGVARRRPGAASPPAAAMRAFMVARRRGFPVGFATLAVGGDGVEIDQLYVTPERARRGIGARAGRGRARGRRARDARGSSPTTRACAALALRAARASRPSGCQHAFVRAVRPSD